MATAKIDKWGRIKLPAYFLKTCREESEDEVFITSTDDETIEIYPLAVWHTKVDKLLKGRKKDPLLRQFLVKTNYNGQVARLDRFGRVQIPSLLWGKIKMEGGINIEEKEGHLELRPEIP